jgi:hypothetical protein
LLREWQRVREWLDETRGDIRLQRQLAVASQEWRRAEKDAGFLLSGSRLHQFDEWEGETQIVLTAEEAEYLEASIAQREREETEWWHFC